MKTNSLFKKFIIQSIVSVIITGGLLAYFVSDKIIQQEINHNIEIVNLTFGHSLEHWFDEVDLYNLDANDIADLDKEFHSLRSLGDISDIRIWRLDGSLAYAQEKALIDNLPMKEKLIAVATSGNTDYEIIQSQPEAIKVYLPINDHNVTLGVFEVTRSFEASRDSINSSVQYVLLILSAGLILLYIFLAKTIYNSSNKLITQKDELTISYEKLNTLFKSMIKAITRAIDARDKFTSGHSQRVATISTSFAKYLCLEPVVIDDLEISALLHDIGKLGVPESIINKPGPLSDSEYDSIKTHPLAGAEIIKDITELQYIIDVVKYHHEKYNGEGYPFNLSGDSIPYIARIISITDAYDAMVSNRPYRKGLTIQNALEEIHKNSGTQFDPDLANDFIQFMNTQDNEERK